MSRKRVLIITGDPLGVKLAGPAIRAWNIAECLAGDNDVVLASFTAADITSEEFSIRFIPADEQTEFINVLNWADIIIFQGHAMLVFPMLQDSKKILIADVYDPLHLEQLEQGRSKNLESWRRGVQEQVGALNQQLLRADFMVCASERQRYFWLGQLGALGRINPENYLKDNSLRSLIDVVPFGLSRKPPVHNRKVLRGQVAGIGEADKVILWSGGLYDWFDPKTLILAVARLSLTRASIRLYFQGTKHPHPGVPTMPIVGESIRLAADLDLLDKVVFFNSSWVDYEDRQNYLLEADVGVSTHLTHIETAFSFRTRILDYLWAELPMVVTEGDHFADVISRENLGIAVPPGDVDALTIALEKVLFDDEYRSITKQNIRRVRAEYFWDVVLKPLASFVKNASEAPDAKFRNENGSGIFVSTGTGVHQKNSPLRSAIRLWKLGGFKLVWNRSLERLLTKNSSSRR